MNFGRTFIVFIVLVIYACSNEPQSGKDNLEIVEESNSAQIDSDRVIKKKLPKDPNGFYIEDWESKFLYQTPILVFNEDSINNFYNEFMVNEYDTSLIAEPVIGELTKKIDGIKKLEDWHMSINEGTNFLYSVQRKDGFVGITLIGMNDAWVNEIKYLTFSLEGKKIGEFVMAADGGDGGYIRKGSGTFIDDLSYKYSYVETEHNSITLENDTIEIGTINTKISLDGKLETTSTKSYLN